MYTRLRFYNILNDKELFVVPGIISIKKGNIITFCHVQAGISCNSSTAIFGKLCIMYLLTKTTFYYSFSAISTCIIYHNDLKWRVGLLQA